MLKGAVLRQYYPEPWLRTSGDIDILVEHTICPVFIALHEPPGAFDGSPSNRQRFRGVC